MKMKKEKSPVKEKILMATIYYQDDHLFYEKTRDCDTYMLYGFLKAIIFQMEESFKHGEEEDIYD